MAALFGGDVEGLFATHSPPSISAHSSAAADDGSSFHASVAHRPQISAASAAASADRSSSAAFGSMEHYMYCDDGARDGEVDVLPYDIYFRNSGFSFNVPVVDSQAVTEDVDGTDGKRYVTSDSAVFKGKQNHRKRNVESPKSSSSGAAVTDTKDFVVVRARRGQATDRHSIAERARREKIRKRMNYLQELVPGCCKSGAGKTVILDEIINYVKSLQNQVEFLSMKLSAATAGYDLSTGAGVDGCGATFSEIPYVAPITSTGDDVFGGPATNIASEPFLDSETSIEYGGDRFYSQPQMPSLY